MIDHLDEGPVKVPDEAPALYAENIRLTARVKELEAALEEIDSITVNSGGDIHGVSPAAWEVAFMQAQDTARAALGEQR